MTGLTLYIVRHGQTEWNLASRMQGRLDSPLTAVGRAQADLHGRTLARLGGVDLLVASPLGRTRATADLLRAHVNVAVSYEPALMERDCGVWSGMTLAEIEAAYPDDWRARAADPYHHRPPQGENLVDMEERIGGFVDALVGDFDARVGDFDAGVGDFDAGVGDLGDRRRSVALVTHGVMSRVILKRLLGLTSDVAVQVRHPNELFYRLDIRHDLDARSIDSAHFIAGEGPRCGLLHQDGGETIRRSE